MLYTIKQSSIASIIVVTDDSGNTTDCIYMAENKQPEAYKNNSMAGNGVAAWDDLPLTVKAFVNRQFSTVFALPVADRQDFVKSCVPTVLEA